MTILKYYDETDNTWKPFVNNANDAVTLSGDQTIAGEKTFTEDVNVEGDIYSNGENLMPESGSNARGSWTRMPDGTQMCWADSDQIGSISTGGGAGSVEWVYPMPFSERPSVTMSPHSASSATVEGRISSKGLTSCEMVISRSNNTATGWSSIAIGRWK